MTGVLKARPTVENVGSHDDEPTPGLPGPLPAGERVLWQGAPDWRPLFWRAFFGRWAALYFAVLMSASALSALAAGEGLSAAALSVLDYAPAALAGLGILAGLGWLFARTAIYTITNRRVVIRHGVAMTLCVNVPFRRIGAAAVRLFRDGSGDLPLTPSGSDRFAYLALWPFVRPHRVSRPEPMLRGVPDAAAVAELLAEALADEQKTAEAAGDWSAQSAAEPEGRAGKGVGAGAGGGPLASSSPRPANPGPAVTARPM